MHIRILLLFVAAAFAEDIGAANRVDRSRGDIDDIGPAFPFEAFGMGYEDFISKIHPPLLAAMNYRPVMPHDIPHYMSDGQVTSAALSSKSDGVVDPNGVETKFESITSATFEVHPSAFEAPGPASANSRGDSSVKTSQESVASETREESTEEIGVEMEDDSEKSIPSEEKPLPSSSEKSKDSAEKEFADEPADATLSVVHESEDSELKESKSSKIGKSQKTQESQHVSSEESEIRKSSEGPNSSSGDDYYYYTVDYIYDESEDSESNLRPTESISDDILMTSSYEYSDVTSTPEYYSSESIESGEKVFIFPESHQIKDISGTKEEFVQTSHFKEGQLSSTESNAKRESHTDINSSSKLSDTFKERESYPTISKPASTDSESQMLSNSLKATQISSESTPPESESENSPSSTSMRKQSESYSAKISFSADGEAAASTFFSTSSKSSELSREFLNKPQVMEKGILLKDNIEVHGQKLDLESMRKVIEHSYTDLSSLRKKLTRRQNVLTDLNQVIDELQKLCQAICVTVPEQYLMTDSDAAPSMVKSKFHSD